MKTCPKCGGNRIDGPRYHNPSPDTECLIYKCGICGYTWKEPTADQKHGLCEGGIPRPDQRNW